MADRRKTKQKRRQNDPEKPTKEQYSVGKFLRFNVPIKEGKLMGMTVQYFKANKAIDALMESKFVKQKESFFVSRAGAVDYCNILLEKGLFHRAAREKKRDKDKRKPKEIQDSPQGEKKKRKGKEKKEEEKEEEEEKEDTKEDEEEKKEEKKEEEKKKREKRKLKLEMHDHQIFVDDDEVYVWIYDPVPLKTFLIGLLLVFGAIAVCLFPLWPPEVRLGVYYLSLAAGGFVVVILSLCVIRFILFCLVWGLTFGKHHFWFLPNLTEDVGFFDSFKPLYKHDAVDHSQKKDKDTKKSEKTSKKEQVVEEPEKKEEGENGDKKDDKGESGSEGSQDNGYEIVDAEDIEMNEDEELHNDSADEEPKKTK